ncbi:putative disease resistance protein RGA4 [Phoenix dactylifera]|uniref:Disease resistance protein RGA4 n=1 Tax=Phoenix dactylifera TaxID=42345 RepID=A0A8B9A5I4_PHODC|nr:putative disease resistance protein RGA4 [Phoenix dactylifera]
MVGVEVIIAGWAASPLISKAIDMLKSYLEDNHDLDKDMKRRLGDVQLDLPRIERAINAAEGWPIEDKPLLAWLRQVKDAAYKAEDLLDDLESKFHQGENKVRASSSSKLQAVKRTVLTDDDLKNLKNLVNDLERINPQIKSWEQVLQQHNANMRAAISKNRFFLTPQEVIGRTRETDRILRRLLRGEEGTSSTPSFVVLPIVGIGGVGKSTLAWHIYTHERLFPEDKSQEDHFSWKVWLNVSKNLDIIEIANKLVLNKESPVSEIVDDRDSVNAILEDILKKFKKLTKDQKFLIVLDDVWDVDTQSWDKLKSFLACGARGSTILITTQYKRVAKIMRTMKPIKLDVLTDDDYQQLLEQCTFGGDQNLEEQTRQDLQSIGRKISILRGLPRAANALGNMLRPFLDSNYWETFLNSKWWEHNKILRDVLPSLGLNYQNLDASQKLCFAYCSIFPRGHKFEQNRLVHMWMAQGFIQPKTAGKMRIEDIGRQVFAELVHRNFFQKISENEYVMHDIIRELAEYLSSDECSVINDETEQIQPGVRHVTVTTQNLVAFNDLSMVEKLRTILFFGNYETDAFYKVLKSILKYSKSLRVLDLSYSNSGISKLPKAISHLSHLRYLDISNTKICWLPKLFCKLYHLQVLNLQLCDFNELPKGMNKLTNLRHLCAESKTVSLISGIGKLTYLQELKEFHVSKKKGHKIEELKDLRALRGQLLIQNLENIDSKEEAMKARLSEKRHLDALHLYFEIKDGPVTRSGFISTRILKVFSKSENTPNLKGLLEGLEPYCDIKELVIKGYDSEMFPSWLRQLTSLQELQFSNCDNLQHLPDYLVNLSLLKKLTICDCPKVMSLPKNLLPASLKELHISGCQLLKERCQKEGGPDWPNIACVPCICIDQEIIQMLQEGSSDTAATSMS